ncbi:MAG: hypothetical protein PCFJNLEI_02074 [Verrucomicrobiae bacterium]|nr:hypothetical protein [Verrucomicrobiae bacterium]
MVPKIVCDAQPDWLRLTELAWRIAAAQVEQPPLPGWKPQMCCMPGTGIIWMWDSCFMTLFARYGAGVVPVMNNLDNLYRLQRDDGLIGMAYETGSEQLAYGERINPPLLAWAEVNYWRLTGDDSRLSQVMPKLVRFFDWIKTNRRRPSGLYWFEDSGSSGMDNSPRSGYFAEKLNGSDVCHVDLAAQQALAAECIATLARHLGDVALAARFEQEYREIATVVQLYHWNKATGFFYDVFNRDDPAARHNHLNHKTVAGFWPLVAGICTADQVAALIKHLLNPAEFWTRHPVASLSKDDPNFDPGGGYWLGGVWPPMNYMIAKGLQRSGRADLARRVAVAHLAGMAAVHQSPPYTGIWEAYAPDFLQPATKKLLISQDGSLNSETIVRDDFVGWGGLGPIAMLLEDVLGFDFDAPRRRITWHLQTDGRHGVEGVRFNGGLVSLLATEAELVVTTETALSLAVLVNGTLRLEQQLSPGMHRLPFARS